MLLRKHFAKTNHFFNKNIKSVKSFILGEYKKHPENNFLANPFSCCSRRNHQFEQIYSEVVQEFESDQDNAEDVMEKQIISMQELKKEDDEMLRKSKKEDVEMLRKIGKVDRGEKGDMKVGKSNENGGSYRLAQKMKEMEMMDVGNVDHVLDVEEVLHYYSRLKSPVYLDIVDKFFTDMNSEIVHPQPLKSKNSNSKRRLAPLQLCRGIN